MEEAKKPTNPPNGRFMDIAGPSSGGDQPKSAPAATETPGASSEPVTQPPVEVAIDSVPEVAEPVAEPPVVETPAEPAAEDKPTNQPEEPAQPDETPAAVQEEHSNEQPQLPPKAQHKAPLIAIFVAMAICLVLTGLVVFTYIKSKNDTKTGTTTSSNSTTTVEKPQASPDDIDQTSAEIDETLSSVNDDADFAASALSDQALGL